MITLSKKFKVELGQSKEKFIEQLNINVAKMFVENNADPNDHTWSYQAGLDGDDFANDEYTCIITALKFK